MGEKLSINTKEYEYLYHGQFGICERCKEIVRNVDPVALKVYCFKCNDHTVMGTESSLHGGLVELIDANPEYVPAKKKKKLSRPQQGGIIEIVEEL